MWLLADVPTSVAATGVGAFLIGVATIMFTQLRHNDDASWKIIKAKDDEIDRLKRDLDYWQGEAIHIAIETGTQIRPREDTT